MNEFQNLKVVQRGLSRVKTGIIDKISPNKRNAIKN